MLHFRYGRSSRYLKEKSYLTSALLHSHKKFTEHEFEDKGVADGQLTTSALFSNEAARLAGQDFWFYPSGSD